ncbi:MAG: HDOD domain-containing protein [Thermodesulfobacteriota bacterium]
MKAERSPSISLPRLLKLVESSSIASIRGTVSGILGMINDPAANPNDLKALIRSDPPLAAAILRMANSSFYAPSRTIGDIDQALIWIGLDALEEIILTQKMSELYREKREFGVYSRQQVWRHSVAVALMCKFIYRREFGERGCNAYAAGLMHDIGVIIEDQLLHSQFEEALNFLHTAGCSLTAAEFESFGYDHGRIGKALAERWKFPVELAEGIGCHHHPEQAARDHCRFAKTVFVSDYLMFEHGYGYVDMAMPPTDVFHGYVADLGLTDYALSSIVGVVRQEMRKIEEQGWFVA